jgi:release factor glutamine methyltransferase
MARLDREVLLADVLERSRAWIIAHPDACIATDAERQLESVARRLKQGEPLAYIRGFREFRGMRFDVNAAVLVPRPETELLVEVCLELAEPGDTILDLGTGSGAIAISIASARPDLNIVATDISREALVVARANAERHGTKVEFIEGDWFEPFIGEQNRSFDTVIANPPYIAEGHDALQALRAEPRRALVSGPDGLKDLRRIVGDAHRHVGRWLLIEHGYDQGAAVRSLLKDAGFTAIETTSDYAGHPRFTRGKRE